MADNLEIINCPACGAKMEKVFIPSRGFNLDVCVNGCGGIYFDNREFKNFDEPFEDITPLTEVLKDKEFKPVDQNITRKCPVCRSDMIKNYTSANKEIQVDDCYTCGGKFLDYGELNKIRAQYDTEKERATDVLGKLYEDVGIGNVIPVDKLPRQRRNLRLGAINGFLIGIIVASIYVFYLGENVNNDNINLVISSFVMICLLCTMFGALFSKK